MYRTTYDEPKNEIYSVMRPGLENMLKVLPVPENLPDPLNFIM